MKPEKKLEKEIIAYCERTGWFCHHFDANGLDGWPDLVAVKGKKYRLIEVKSGTKLRNEQIAFHFKMRMDFGVVIYTLEKKGELYWLNLKPYESLGEAMGAMFDES